jgi:hypothetical protein
MRRPMPAIACPATLSPVILAAQNPRAIGTPACSASFLAQVNEQHAPPHAEAQAVTRTPRPRFVNGPPCMTRPSLL